MDMYIPRGLRYDCHLAWESWFEYGGSGAFIFCTWSSEVVGHNNVSSCVMMRARLFVLVIMALELWDFILVTFYVTEL